MTPDSLIKDAKCLIEQSRQVQNGIIENVQPESATFTSVLLPLAQNENLFKSESHVMTFHQAISPNQALRDASNEVKRLFNDFAAETAMREDVFVLVDAVWKNRKDEDLDTESLLFLEKEHGRFLRNGLGLPAGPGRERFREIKRRLSELTISFHKNLNEESDGIWFTLQELQGVPSDVLERLEKGPAGSENEGKLRLTFQWSDYFPTMDYATNTETRKRMCLGNENKCAANVRLFSETIVLRDEAARLLGYSNHAAFRLEDKMIKSPQEVNSFLEDLRSRLATRGAQELAELKELKRGDLGDENYDGYLYIWDNRFYSRMLLQQRYSVDKQKIAEYFPLQPTMQAILGTFENLFGLVFIKYGIPKKNEKGSSLLDSGYIWHESVHLYAVWNSPEEGDDFLGYLYLDLHPRPGKFSHAANFNLQPGFTHPNHTRHHPSTLLICNFPPPTASSPSLLTHEDLILLFHELGHCIHDLVSRTRHAAFHGTNTVQDFCEAPSQMLELCAWDPALLSSLSNHYVTGSKLPGDMLGSLVRSKGVNGALAALRQLHVSVFDMQIHQPRSPHHSDSLVAEGFFEDLYCGLWAEITGFEGEGGSPDYGNQGWGHGYATFFHLMGDYDAGYYGYLISKVYALDMFYRGFGGRVGDEKAGRRYRRMVLEKGGAQPAGEMVRGFLGGGFSYEAFLKEVGLD